MKYLTLVLNKSTYICKKLKQTNMEIKVKKQVEELVNIELPYYCSSIAHTVAVLSEKQCIVITHSTIFNGIEVREFINDDWFTDDDYDQVTEDQFSYKYESMLQSLLLIKNKAI